LTVDYILKKTSALSAEEKRRICALFGEVFGKEKTLERFDRQFLRTPLGGSYHGLMVAGDKIVGVYATIPFRYRYFGRTLTFALAVDTMIAAPHRGNPFNLKKMAKLVYGALVQDGIPFVFGFPNDNIYLVRKKVLGWADIGALDFFVLPLRIGAVVKRLAFLNGLSGVYSYVVNRFPGRPDTYGRANGPAYKIEKVNDRAFIDYRYDYDKEYNIVKGPGGAYFTYKYDVEDGVRVAFLIDAFPLEKNWLETAVRHVYDNSRAKADVIMYVGRLDFRPVNLIKVPSRVSPRQIHMSGKILDPAIVDDRVFDLRNWNVNLANYDVR
jgi:hypothetical protein